jgi:hypothetical protein
MNTDSKRKKLIENLELGLNALNTLPWRDSFVMENNQDPIHAARQIAITVRFMHRWKDALKTYKEAAPPPPAPAFGTLLTVVATGETAMFVKAESDSKLWIIIFPDGGKVAVSPIAVTIQEAKPIDTTPRIGAKVVFTDAEFISAKPGETGTIVAPWISCGGSTQDGWEVMLDKPKRQIVSFTRRFKVVG